MSKIRTFLEMIKFEHTIFALPFAYLGMVLAWAETDAPARLGAGGLLWPTGLFSAGRSASRWYGWPACWPCW